MSATTTDAAGAEYQRALVAHQQGDHEAAARGYESALALSPAHADALHMLGVLCMQGGQHSEAVAFIRRSLRVRNDDATVHSNLATALVALGRFDEAIEACRTATSLAPDSADAWGNLGTSLTRRNRYPEAVEAYRHALELQPERPGLHSALGHALGRMELYEEALASHRRAIAMAPDKPQYRSNMSLTLRAAGLSEEAEKVLRTVIADGGGDPDFLAALASLLKQRGKMEEAVAAYQKVSEQVDNRGIENSLAFLRNYVDSTSVETQLQQARRTATSMVAGIQPLPPAQLDLEPDRVLRVGIVSADFRNHSVARFLRTVIPQIDAKSVMLFAYSGSDTGDINNRAFRSVIKNWRSVAAWTDEELAQRVQLDAIDILVDLSGFTGGSRIGAFARKPAPIAATWLGYSGTTGLDAIDYIIGDSEVLPSGLNQTVETPWRLPDAYLCFAPAGEAPAVGELAALGTGEVTFGSFNNLSKLSGTTHDAWVRILEAVPNGRIVLKHGPGANEGIDRFVETLERRGLSADRVTILPWMAGPEEHLQFYNQIDIGLDPFPYNGTTTTCEALWMGVPVLTLRGDRFVSRVGATLMHNLDMDDWITGSVDEYVTRAVAIAADLPALAELRRGLRQRMARSPLCDAPRFARNLEAAFRGMWRRYCAAEAASGR